MFAGCAFDSGESVGRTADAVAITPATCTVTGSGTLASPPPATFSGSATLVAGAGGSGTWTHTVLAGTRTVCTPSADCPGNGRRVGHYMGRGRGHEIGDGRGHCEHSGEVCTEEPVYDVLVGTPEDGSCAINGSALGTITGSGTWNGAPVTFELNVRDSILFGDNYELTVSDASGVIYYVNDGLSSGDISISGT